MVGAAESQMKGTKPRGGTGSIQRQYDAVLLPRDETKTEAWPSVRLVLGDSPNHPKNPQACLQSKSRDNPYTSTVIHNSQGERRSPRTSSTHRPTINELSLVRTPGRLRKPCSRNPSNPRIRQGMNPFRQSMLSMVDQEPTLCTTSSA